MQPSPLGSERWIEATQDRGASPRAPASRRPALLAALLAALALGTASRAAAQPTAEDPQAPLEAWRTSVSKKLLAEAEKVHAEAVKGVSELNEKRDARQLKQRGVLKRIGDVHVSLLSLTRAANKLVAIGEPAGIDLQFRATELRGELRPIIEETRRLQEETIEKSRTYLDKLGSDMKRRKILDKAELLRLEGKLEQAEAVVLTPFNKMEQMGVWYLKSTDRDASLLPFDLWLNPFESELLRKFEDDSRDALAERRAESSPKFAELLDQLTAAAAAVGRSGSGKFGDESLSGPELVRQFGDAWLSAQRDAAECFAIDQALDQRDELKRWRQEWQKFNDEFAAGLVGLIAADARRSPDADAKRLYSAYCGALGPLVGLIDERSLRQPAGEALYQFVVKSPSLRDGWYTYQQATHDLLRWRQKTSELRAAALARGYADLGGDKSLPRELVEPASRMMADANRLLADKRLRAQQLLGEGPTRVSTPLGGSLLVRIEQDDDSHAQFSATILRNELLASSVYPMLSLEVAAAIAETERGDLVAAGGVVRAASLRAVVPLLANAGREDLGLLRIGVPPVDLGASRQPLGEVRLEVALKPDWWQQRYLCTALQELAAQDSSALDAAGGAAGEDRAAPESARETEVDETAADPALDAAGE